MCVSGLYLSWPRSWSWTTLRSITWFKGGLRGTRRDFNWHNTIGFGRLFRRRLRLPRRREETPRDLPVRASMGRGAVLVWTGLALALRRFTRWRKRSAEALPKAAWRQRGMGMVSTI